MLISLRLDVVAILFKNLYRQICPWHIHTCQYDNFVGILQISTMKYYISAIYYGDVIMSAVASQLFIHRLLVDQRIHQSSASLAFGRGIHRSQRASNAENVSIWWRHHITLKVVILFYMYHCWTKLALLLTLVQNPVISLLAWATLKID